MEAVIIAIGDELLLGKTVNNNAAYLSAQLAALGIPTRRQIVVGDKDEEIQAAVEQARALAPLAVATGGLGPTADDRTLAAVTALWGLELVLHPPTLREIEQHFRRRGIPMPEVNVSQARVPAGARVLRNALGTAPGLIIENEGFILCLLPGVPAEMKYIFENGLRPYLAEKGYGGGRVYEWVIHVVGLPESAVAERVGGLPVPPGVNFAYLPQTAQVDLRLWGKADAEGEFRTRAAPLGAAIKETLGDFVFGEDAETLEEVVGKLLAARGETLAVAESCTGGLVAKRITDVPGASGWFRGGVVAYDNEIKKISLGVAEDTLARFGAVSEETAREMAEGVRNRFGATYGLAVTGIAGPAGGTEAKPVGTVCFACADAHRTMSEKAWFGGGRDWVRLRASQRALDILRRAFLMKGGR